jgi:hypothetical protein
MILDDRIISAKKIAGNLVISQKRVGYIIHDILDMRKLSAKWDHKCLNADQKCERVLVSQAILNRLVTIYGSIYVYMIQRQKSNQKNKDTVVPGFQRSSGHGSHQASCWRLYSGTKMEFCL